MNNKLWIIGDSFAMRATGKTSWVQICSNQFKGNEYYISSRGSRDIQTIFDIFLQNLHKIKPNDFVILMLPTLTRVRLPLAAEYFDSEDSHGFIGAREYTSRNKTTLIKNENRKENKDYTLEQPLNEMDPRIFVPNKNINYPNMATILEIINGSQVMTNNWNLILKSIQLYVPFKLIYYSWTNELDLSIVTTKDVIKNELQMWETLQDVWNKTNGESGKSADFHWSIDMNIKFAEYIIKTYPEYFKYIIK